MTAGVAQIMRALELAAIATFVERFDLQRIMAAAHAPAGRASFSLRDSHFGTCSSKLLRCLKAALGHG
jgi:hypothetical protein